MLREFYGLLPQPPADPFQFFLWEILSGEAFPARRDLAWQALRRLPALTPDAVFRSKPKDLLEAVGMAGPNREERVERMRATTGEFKRHRDEFEDDVLRSVGLHRAARTIRRLSHLPRAVLDRALLFAGNYPVLPMDDPAARVVARLGGTALPIRDGAEGFTLKRQRFSRELTQQRRRARQSLAAALPKELEVYKTTVVYLRHHAQNTCTAVAPHCTVCPLAPVCAFAISMTP